MAAINAQAVPRRGVAYRTTFPIFGSSGLVSGAAGLDSDVSKDAGTAVDCTNEAVEIAPSTGMYYLDLTATEMDARTVAVIVKSSTSGAQPVPIVIYPIEDPDVRVHVVGMADGVLTASAVADNAITDAAVASDVTIASVTGAVGSVAGNVGGSVASVTAGVTLADGAITSAKIADAALTAAKFAAGAFDAVWGVTGRTLSSFGSLAADAATAVWGATTRTLSAGTNIVLAKGTGVTGFNDLSAAQVNAECDTAIADVGLTTTITERIDAPVLSRMAAASYVAPPTANDTADALLDRANAIETGVTPRGALRLLTSVLGGILSGAATPTLTFRNVGNAKTRVTVTADENGNRSAVTTDLT